ncbi:MAG: class II aldolase/adducin family protein [Oscillospiraceae bacterium]|nr:class II aldolase/adducin family protein [Oscillospiraceae bacterium]
MDLTGIIRLSNKYGSDPELVLAGGGNTSVKDAEVLYIKCSGTSLQTITAEGFVPVNRAELEETLTKPYPTDDAGREAAFLADVMTARTIPGETRRPSVEALLHHLFPQKYVVHLHPALINGLTCGKAGQSWMEALFGDKAVWIPVTRPGLVLGKLCHSVMEEHRAKTGKPVSLVFLENHGIFIAADTEEEIADILEQTVATLKGAVSNHPAPAYTEAIGLSAIEEIRQRTGVSHVKFSTSPQILEFLQSRETAEALMTPFNPDQIVYCGAEPAYVTDVAELGPDTVKGKILFVEQVGIFALGQTEKEAELAMLLCLDAIKIAIYAESFGGAQPLTTDLIQFIVSWEAESYRKKEAQ